MGFSQNLKLQRLRHRLSQKELGEFFGLGQTTIANYEKGNRVPNAELLKGFAEYFHTTVDLLLEDSDMERAGGDIVGKYMNLELLQKNFEKYCLDETEEAAIDLIMSIQYDDKLLFEVYENVLTKTMYNVGDLWEQGKISLVKEHYISAIVSRVLSGLAIRYQTNRRVDTNFHHVAVCMTLSCEHHTMGIRMVSEFLKKLGFKSYYLGSNVPTESLIKMLREVKADLLAISLTMPEHLDALANFVTVLRSYKSLDHIRILVGGQAFNGDHKMYSDLGVDGISTNYLTTEQAIGTMF
ncbi:MAG: cobalamin B12-binding domain-containing protein [Vallitaleaceae bacterium]|nr:cobalamin B12-binding domain-containing protein [Vallitaleaceae bacterium]